MQDYQIHENNRFRFVFTFIFHQLMSTLGVVVLTGTVCYWAVSILHAFRQLSHLRATWLLTELPSFPVQSLMGLLLGFGIAEYIQHRSMLLVWVVPFTFFALGALVVVEPSGETLKHFFGSGCTPVNYCYDQTLFTLPLVSSLSYSIGAKLGLRPVQNSAVVQSDLIDHK